ncbi:MAG: hypothetical protein KGL19_07150, partial [Bacteroidota bacterium]|nr:hypothetical protein [Bacteroidota bacterium]
MRIIIIIFFFSIIAGGCKTYSYFNGSNDLLNEYCQVFLVDGTEIDGKITIQFETGHDVDKYLKIQTGNNAEKKILITDIQYYKHNDDYYFPKETNLETYEIPYRDKMYTPNVNNILFMKRLTKENAKIQLFQLFKSRTNSSDGMDQYDYFISLNNENRFVTWSIRGNKFFPDFEEKMSKIVSDCPSLAEKIAQKMNGYAVKQMSLDAKKYEVIKK